MKQVRKRDGRVVNFDQNKITEAVAKAFASVDGAADPYAADKASKIAEYINAHLEDNSITDIETIQDMVEHGLMSTKRKDVARAYITYRNERTKEREYNTNLMKLVEEKLSARNVQNQNANVDEYSFGGRVGEASGAVNKQLALDKYMSRMARDNHLNNEIYIHDLDAYVVGMHNCLSIPFDDLLANGFNTRQTDVRPANSVNTAFQLVAVIFQLQSLQQFGGVSATHIDWTMVPYVRKSFWKHFKDGVKYCQDGKIVSIAGVYENFDWIYDSIDERKNNNTSIEDNFAIRNVKAYDYAMDMTTKEIYQAVEGLYHNLNTLQSRSGNQLPFTSINYGTCTLPEGRMITKALLDVSIEGLGKLHKTSIFPCGIFQCMKGVNRQEGDPNYDLYQLALKSTAKRLYPNYANVDWTGNAGYDKNDPRTYFSTMGKRKLQLM